MKYEITIRQLTEFTTEEKEEVERGNRNSMDRYPIGYSDQPFHETRVLFAEVTQEEFQAVKKAIIGVL